MSLSPSIPLRWRPAVNAVLGLALAALAASAQAQSQRHTGELLAVVLPAATLGTELVRGDTEGAWQFAQSLGATALGTEVLKHTTRVERPDGSDRQSFPSGHAAWAFSSAAYVRQRHGWLAAAPLYLAAAYVGQTRVDARRHRWGDILGSALVAEASAMWLVKPAPGLQVGVVPVLAPQQLGVTLLARW